MVLHDEAKAAPKYTCQAQDCIDDSDPKEERNRELFDRILLLMETSADYLNPDYGLSNLVVEAGSNAAYVITDAEYKMGDGDWTKVNETSGHKLVPADNGADNLYRISIRPEYQNVTGDVTLRVTGEQHERHTITWKNGTAEYLDLEISTLPTLAIDGDMVYAELYVNNQYYLNGATASAEGTGIETMNRCYVRFSMPKEDVTITLDFLSKVPVGYTTSEHVVKAQLYNAPDTYYGVPTEIGIPGENVYLFVDVEEGSKPMMTI